MLLLSSRLTDEELQERGGLVASSLFYQLSLSLVLSLSYSFLSSYMHTNYCISDSIRQSIYLEYKSFRVALHHRALRLGRWRANGATQGKKRRRRRRRRRRALCERLLLLHNDVWFPVVLVPFHLSLAFLSARQASLFYYATPRLLRDGCRCRRHRRLVAWPRNFPFSTHRPRRRPTVLSCRHRLDLSDDNNISDNVSFVPQCSTPWKRVDITP